GSLKITRPTLFTHIGNHDVCQEMANNLFTKVISGQIKIIIGQKFPLSDIALAHDSLESRMTTGSTILTI
ncbi:zinc-binding dehydrogenase, partial [Amylibacter sp.]|nr:zinc-binding dehydrogenase [Amylibacter sp.]